MTTTPAAPDRANRDPEANDAVVAVERLRAMRAHAADPARLAAVGRAADEATAAVDRIRAAWSRCNLTIADGVADAGVELDHDLRQRVGRLRDEAEAWIADNDPSHGWDDLGDALAAALAAEAAATGQLAARLADRLAEGIAALAASTGAPIAPPTVRVARDRTFALPRLAPVPTGAGGKAEFVLVTVRGATSGLVTAGILGGLFGLAVATAVSVVVAVGFAVKTVQDERRRHLANRRTAARQAASRFLDDAGYQLGLQNRELLRTVQRQLRDGAESAATGIVQWAEQARAVAVAQARAEGERCSRAVAEIDRRLAAAGVRPTAPQPGGAKNSNGMLSGSRNESPEP